MESAVPKAVEELLGNWICPISSIVVLKRGITFLISLEQELGAVSGNPNADGFQYENSRYNHLFVFSHFWTQEIWGVLRTCQIAFRSFILNIIVPKETHIFLSFLKIYHFVYQIILKSQKGITCALVALLNISWAAEYHLLERPLWVSETSNTFCFLFPLVSVQTLATDADRHA